MWMRRKRTTTRGEWRHTYIEYVCENCGYVTENKTRKCPRCKEINEQWENQY